MRHNLRKHNRRIRVFDDNDFKGFDVDGIYLPPIPAFTTTGSWYLSVKAIIPDKVQLLIDNLMAQGMTEYMANSNAIIILAEALQNRRILND